MADFFGGTDKRGFRAQQQQNRSIQDFARSQGNQARTDIFDFLSRAGQPIQEGINSAIQVQIGGLSRAAEAQNVANLQAQMALLGGAPIFTPQNSQGQFNRNFGFLNQQAVDDDRLRNAVNQSISRQSPQGQVRPQDLLSGFFTGRG